MFLKIQLNIVFIALLISLVVEAFFVGSEDKYLEVELSP